MRLGLALGGGAARGFAHVGVLEVLEEEDIPVGAIAGTSIGALIGAVYACEPSVAALRERIDRFVEGELFRKIKRDFLKAPADRDAEDHLLDRVSAFIRKSIFYTLSMTRKAFVSEETLRDVVAELVPDVEVEQTRIPFAAVALDISRGKKYVFRSGSLRTAVQASCALPGVMVPVVHEGKVLVDGGWVEAVPVETVREMGADVVVGVNICSALEAGKEPARAIDVLLRADRVCRGLFARTSFAGADCLISPDVGGVDWSDFSDPGVKIERGREAALKSLPRLRAVLERKGAPWWRRLLGGLVPRRPGRETGRDPRERTR